MIFFRCFISNLPRYKITQDYSWQCRTDNVYSGLVIWSYLSEYWVAILQINQRRRVHHQKLRERCMHSSFDRLLDSTKCDRVGEIFHALWRSHLSKSSYLVIYDKIRIILMDSNSVSQKSFSSQICLCIAILILVWYWKLISWTESYRCVSVIRKYLG